MNTVIRPMEERDRERVLGMMRAFYASPAVLSDGSEEIFTADFDACVGENPFLEGYVFEEAGELSGYAMAAKSFSTEFGRQCVWIEDLYIREEYRGRGIGTLFLDFIIKKYPGAVFRLEVEEDNAGAVKVYKKRGFEFLDYEEMVKKY